MSQLPDDDLQLPKNEFTYLAGSSDRPWEHFTGRWQAIKPVLNAMLAGCSQTRPLRVVDLGSCSGYFALKAAYRHPEADVVAVEGSIGIGNGTAGMQGTVRQILRTEAVQTHLRWIQKLKLANCFLAPEVWDYLHICNLAAPGRPFAFRDGQQHKPICDVMFLLSVVHHIDNISAQQYARAGLSRVQGGIELLAKLLMLAPRHFVELPQQPWLKELFEEYGTARKILEAAAKATGRQWLFRGPIFTAEWFGTRDLWVLEAQAPMLDLDIQSCPFPLLYRGNESDEPDPDAVDTKFSKGDGWNFPGEDNLPLDMKLEDLELASLGALTDPNLVAVGACENISGTLLQPAAYATASDLLPAPAEVAAALKAAPTALLLAHLTLREAIAEAEDLLATSNATNLSEAVEPQKP
ncbi:unnamed protein product [Effrenium voratum]|uniref:Uncharacterized protein n=1 Tax=Effrenium voratum TaxID=2562239 RepID=A0AA36IZT3_9DINO|nr:unnamed protein product [Effrenium voratum]CAJ1427240.1 unnamed protein product [Effrenium voratum]